MHALEGLRVLDTTRLLPGAVTSMLLADFGAEVIKVEEPGRGDYEREFPPVGPGGTTGYRFQLINRNKQSVGLNLKDPRGVEAFSRLVKTADVVLEGFRPGVATRLGIGFSTLSEINPRLIYCALSGYGQTGPYAQLPGHDLNYLALSGVLSMTGTPERPILPGVQIADLGAGALMAVVGILTALAARERTGRGQMVDVSMFDGSVFWLIGRAQSWFGAATVPERGSLPATGASPANNVYRTKDDKFISVACLEPRFWTRLCEALDLPDLAAEMTATGARRAEIFALFRTRFAELTRDEWFERLRKADTCAAPMLDLGEVWDDPHVRARGMIADVEHPVHGRIRQIGVPVKLSETPGTIRSAPPDLGEQTDAILESVGYSVDERASLRAAGVIR